MNREENVENLLRTNHRLIKTDADNFGVTGVAIANVLITRIRLGASGVAAGDISHTLKLNVSRI